MEPTQPSAGTPGGAPNNLDPQVIKLADSIAKTESGGDSTAKGKSGEYGAYQWMPDTWNTESKAAGINVPLDQSTPEQQNEVAYKAISNYKNQGYSPAQIASLWNSGDPNAYLGTFSEGDPSEGTNSAGVQFNVPGYVDKVMGLFDGEKSNSPTPSMTSSDSSDQKSSNWLTALEGLGAGALGFLGGGIAKLGGAALTAGGAGLGEMVGGPIGGVVGGTLGEEAAKTFGLDNDAQKDNSQDQTSQQSQDSTIGENPIPQSTFASKMVQDAITQTLGTTQSNRAFTDSTEGKSAIQTASMFGLITPDEEGNLQFNEEKRQKSLRDVAELDDKIISSDESSASPVQAANFAGNYIGGSKLYTKEDRQKAGDKVGEIIRSDFGQNMNSSVSLSDLREQQKAHYAKAKKGYREGLTTPDILAHMAVANGYGKAIAENLKSPEAKELHGRALKMEQSLIHAKGLEKKIQGRRPPKASGFKEAFLRQSARAAEIYIGDKIGGPIGAVIGGILGENINHKLDRKFGRNIFETKGMKAALDILKDTRPKEYDQLINALKNHEVNPHSYDSDIPDTQEGKVKDVRKDIKVIRGLIDLS